MTDIKEKATAMWTALLEALRADGLVGQIITQSGPATTNFIVEKCQEPSANGPWLPMHMLPQPGVQVVALDKDGGLHVVMIEDSYDEWVFVHNGQLLNAGMMLGYTFIKQPEQDNG